MTTRSLLEVTAEEVMRAIERFDFEFFADLIRRKQYIAPEAREMAADFVLANLRGLSKRQRGKIEKRVWYSKIADYVEALAPQEGVERAIQLARREFRGNRKQLAETTVRKAWGIRLLQSEFSKDYALTIVSLGAQGVPAEEAERILAKKRAAYVKAIDRRLQKNR